MSLVFLHCLKITGNVSFEFSSQKGPNDYFGAKIQIKVKNKRDVVK